MKSASGDLDSLGRWGGVFFFFGMVGDLASVQRKMCGRDSAGMHVAILRQYVHRLFAARKLFYILEFFCAIGQIC